MSHLKSAVVYQVYPRSFQDSNGDGIGDIRGVIQRLDYLAGLGVDVVWLSPVYRSPQDDNGYDISDYQDIDPQFGTLEDIDELIAAMHERGMKLVMDLVVNHTSDEHAWFEEAKSSKDNPKRDWFMWYPAREGFEPGTPGAEPTNWESAFSGPAWTYHEPTGEYFLHLFSKKQPDLNWENPEVRQAVYAMMRWWLDRGVDGFRMDVINLISKTYNPDGSLSDIPEGRLLRGEPFVANGPRLHEFLQEMHREVFEGRRDQLLLVGETPSVTVDDGILMTDPARNELDMVFTFEHMDLDRAGKSRFHLEPIDVRELKATLGRWQTGLNDRGWNALYWNNHDQPRIVSRFGDDGEYRELSAKMLGIVLHMHRGTPYIYQGEELGMTNAPFSSISEYRDLDSLNWAALSLANGTFDEASIIDGLGKSSRDHARTPMQWDASAHAGFTTGTPWIEANANYPQVNVEQALADENSVYYLYRDLIALRHNEAIVREGDFQLILEEDPNIYAFTRSFEGEELLVLGNFTGQEQEAEVGGDWGNSELVIANYSDPAQPTSAGVQLRPWEAVVYRRAVV